MKRERNINMRESLAIFYKKSPDSKLLSGPYKSLLIHSGREIKKLDPVDLKKKLKKKMLVKCLTESDFYPVSFDKIKPNKYYGLVYKNNDDYRGPYKNMLFCTNNVSINELVNTIKTLEKKSKKKFHLVALKQKIKYIDS